MICPRMMAVILAAFLAYSSAAAAAEVIKDCPNCPPLVKVPAGSFVMGLSDAGIKHEGLSEKLVADERPRHKVTIAKPFALGEHPVTRGEYAEYVRETGHVSKGCLVFNGRQWINDEKLSWRNPGYVQNDRHPVVCVSFDDAEGYVQWLSKKTGKAYRLPSEAEWEYAERAGTTTIRFWGDGRDQACQYANVGDLFGAGALRWNKEDKNRVFQCNDGFAYTSPVGMFKPNAFGLYDMLGNVYQWMQDCYHDSYKGAPTDGSAWVDKECKGRAQRGGSWSNGPLNTRSAARNGGPPEIHNIDVGFRVARSLEP
jgi:sulfatase modifying factor 1